MKEGISHLETQWNGPGCSGETLIVGQNSSPPAVPGGGVQHIKGQRGITSAERSKALCHERLQQAPG